MMEVFTLHLPEAVSLTDDQLFYLCEANKELRIERTSTGELIIMPPAGGESSAKNSIITMRLTLWNSIARTGIVFDSSGGFTLPNKAMRAPDASWVALERWQALTDKERKQFPPLCPDFLIELMSESDALRTAQEKMQEWMSNGCRLAWLINPKTETAYIYRRDKAAETVDTFG
ncbi:MAG: Uma2 family endonuclease, partial [Rhizobacter sp.]|nr:Uma2 family endonuclease [Chlorobiales bacterium]